MHGKGIQLPIVLEYLSVGILEGMITKTVPSYLGAFPKGERVFI